MSPRKARPSSGGDLASVETRDSNSSSPASSDSVEFAAFQDGKRVRMSAEERVLLNNTFCEICGGMFPFENNPIVLCDGTKCNKAFHIQCMTPPLDKLPEGDFFGPCCDASKRTQVKGSALASGRSHMRRMRLMNRSQPKQSSELDGSSAKLPIEGLFNQFSKSYSTRRKSSLVQAIDTDEPIFKTATTTKKRHRSIPSDGDKSVVSDMDCSSVGGTNQAAPSIEQDTPSDESSWHQALMSSHKKLIEDLQPIVGMERIKEILVDINCKINLRKERIRRSVSPSGSSNSISSVHVGSGMAPHIALVGNPGTGKSMIGRILAKMLHRAHAVKRNIFVKAHRSDLVAGYLGQTALKTSQLIEQARGGVMFIDEAHQLINPNKEDYGIEAYREIMKEMLSEHSVDEDRVTFIFAGYPRQMKRFLNHDSGMESRISFRIALPDYSLGELARICESKILHRDPKEGLPTDMDPNINLEEILETLPCELVPNYNARISDLLLDKAEACLARRMLLSENLSNDVDIFRLTERDFQSAAASLRHEMLQARENRSPESSDSEP